MKTIGQDFGNRWLLPDGVEEFLPPDAERLEFLRRQILDLFHSWGYELVIPPIVEYIESLLVGVGHDLDVETYKLIDQMNGRTMGVRADITPQVARIDAHRLKRKGLTRLCYFDTVLRTKPKGKFGSRNPLQIGAELYGHSGFESDAEVLQLMVEMLSAMGICNIQVDIGHVGFYRTLIKRANINSDQESFLFKAIQSKSKPDIEAFLKIANIDNQIGKMILGLIDLHGGISVLQDARDLLGSNDNDMMVALRYLENVCARFRSSYPDVALRFDLGELKGYNYQSGVVFAAYIEGLGQEIARGGRYDEIGRVFGRSRPATGFSSDLKTLINLATIENNKSGLPIIAPDVDEASLLDAVTRLRNQGERVVFDFSGEKEFPLGQCRKLAKIDGKWQVKQ